MAYAYQQENQQDQIAQENAQPVSAQGSSVVSQDQGSQGGGQQQQLSSAPSQIESGGAQNYGAPSQRSSKQTPSGGSGFANISKYLEQNQPQAMKLGERVAGSIEDKANQAREGIQQGSQAFQDQVNQNMVQYNQDLADRAAQDAYQFSQNQDDVDAFKKMYSGQYSGPSNFQQQENYVDILNQVTGAQNQARLAETESGRKQLVTDLQESRRPSQGIASLNNLLLQNSPDAVNRIQEATSSAFDLDDYFNSVMGEANQLAQQAADTSAQTGLQTQQMFNPLQDQIISDVQQRQQDTFSQEKAIQDLQNALVSSLSGRESSLTPEQLELLGIDQQGYDDLLNSLLSYDQGYDAQKNRANQSINWVRGISPGVVGSDTRQDMLKPAQNVLNTIGSKQSIDPLDFLNTSDFNDYSSMNNFATEDEVLRYQALNDLLGLQNTELDFGNSQYVDPSVSFNYDDVMRNISDWLADIDQASKIKVAKK